MNNPTVILAWIGTGCWVVCFWWMHRLSGRQEAMLKELHEVASRIEKFSKAELHPAVKQIKEHVAGVAIAVAADDASGQAIKH